MISDLMWLIEKDVQPDRKKQTTFLSVLGRTYDEDLISRVLVYVMEHDHAFVHALLRRYAGDIEVPDFEQADVFVYPEKSMGKGRADIFAVIKKNEVTIATITIENKIYSTEHDDQTHTYYDWVYRQQEYKHANVNAFFYLRPSFNSSTAVCDQYQNITYTQIAMLISQSDYIIDDFKKHIALYLGESNMELNEKQINIINHFEAIEQSLNEATAIYASNKTVLLDAITHVLKQRIPDIKWELNERLNPLGPVSVRLYRDKWYKAGEYYFYSELYFEKSKIDRAKYQNVVKEYPKKSTEKSIQEFLHSDLIDINSTLGQWHIWGEVSYFTSCYEWTSNEWSNAFISESIEKLTVLIKETNRMVDTFLAFAQHGI